MRRRSALLFLAVLGVIGGLRFSAAAADTEAMRCAIACGHALAAASGAACCPAGNAPQSGPAFRTCPRGAGEALVPLTGQPILVASSSSLEAPERFRFLDSPASEGSRAPFLRVPEKVPLSLG